MVDIARLNVKIDSEGASKATKDLERLQRQSEKNVNANRNRAASQLRSENAMKRAQQQARRLEIQNQKLEREQRKLNATAKNTAESFGRLRSVFGGLAAAFSGAAFVRASDEFVNLTTKIENVTESSEEAQRVYRQLFGVAQETGSKIGGLGNAFLKLNVSIADNLKESTDLVKVTELLARGFTAAGANAQTVAATTLQLTQGLASDFQNAGQELNSFIEQAPVLAGIVSRNLGGESAVDLKKLAETGELTAESFIKALLAAEDAIKAFRIPETVNRSVTRLDNAFIDFIGTSNNASGAAGALSNAINRLAQNIDILAAAGAGLAVIFASRIVGGLAQAGIQAAKTTTAFAGATIAAKGLSAAAAGLRGVLGVLGGPAGAIFAVVSSLFLFSNRSSDAADIQDILQGQLKQTTGSLRLYKEELEKLNDVQRETARFELSKSISKTQESVDELRDDLSTRLTGPFVPITGGPALAQLNQLATLFDAGAINAEKYKLELLRLESQFEDFTADSRIKKLETLIQAQQRLGDAQERLAVLSGEKPAPTRGSANKSVPIPAISPFADDKVEKDIKKATDAALNYEDSLEDIRREVDRFANSSAEAFADFITGADSAGNAINRLANDILKLSIRKSVTEPLSSGLSGLLTGGLFSGTPSTLSASGVPIPGMSPKAESASFFSNLLPGFAEGGSFQIRGRPGFDKNLLSLNDQPIAKVSRGENVSVDNASNGNTLVEVNVVNNTPANVDVRESGDNQSKRLEIVIDEAVASNISNPGTKTARALRGNSAQTARRV